MNKKLKENRREVEESQGGRLKRGTEKTSGGRGTKVR
jgi:hypothetical protein